MGFGLVSWEKPLFYWFQGCHILKDDENFERGEDVKKEEDQISSEDFVFIFIN